MALKDIDGLWQEKVKPLGADVVEYAPNPNQGVDHALVEDVLARPFPRYPDSSRVTMSQQRDRILAVVPGSIDNRVQNRASVLLGSLDLPRPELLNQFPFCLAGHDGVSLHSVRCIVG